MKIEKFNKYSLIYKLLGVIFLVFVYVVNPNTVQAGDEVCGGCAGSCYEQRSLSQWSCDICTNFTNICAGSASVGCLTSAQCAGWGYGNCVAVCDVTGSSASQCQANTINQVIGCYTAPGYCEATGVQTVCTESGQSCLLTQTNATYGCCGPGNCSGTPTYSPPTSGPGTNTPTPPVLTNSVTPTVVATLPSSCTISLGNINLALGQTQKIIPGINQVNGTVDEVTFTSSFGSVVAVCDAATGTCASGSGTYVDSTSAFEANLTAIAIGNATITVSGRMIDEGNIACTGTTANVVVGNILPWFLTGWGGGGDITTTGYLIDNIPSTDYFMRPGPGGYPSIPLSSLTNVTAARTSTTGWNVQTAVNISSQDNYEYSYYEGRCPSTVPVTAVGPVDLTTAGTAVGVAPNTYYVVKYGGGDFNINSDLDLGDRKVVLFVQNGNLNIKGKVNLNNGVGSFTTFVNGDINIDPSVGGGATADIEGFYFAQGQIKTGTYGNGNDQTLTVRGSFAGMGYFTKSGIVLERSLSDNFTAAEQFNYGLDQILRFPPFIGKQNVKWREVSP